MNDRPVIMTFIGLPIYGIQASKPEVNLEVFEQSFFKFYRAP